MGARGEAVIQTDDHDLQDVTILYTNRAIAEAEEAAGKGILEMLDGFQSGTSGIRELAHLLQAGMEGARRDARLGGRRVSLGRAYDVLDAVGFTAVAEAVMLAVSAVLVYGTEAEGELEALEGEGPNL